MSHTIQRVILFSLLVVLPSLGWAEEAPMGSFSLVTNPPVMVYLDGARVGMSPLINRQLPAGEHRMALLLILPNNNRLRADYVVMVAAGRETVASLDLAHDAPAAGEVRTLSPDPAATPTPPPPPPPNVTPTNPPATAPATPPQQVAWATNPGRPSQTTVAVAATPPTPPPAPTPPPPPPPENYGLSRSLVREGLEALRPAVMRCMEGRSGVVQVRMVIQPDGGVTEVEAQGVFRGTQAGECIARAIPEEAAFPIYEGEPIPVVYPYHIATE
jgi:hypothetical protein